MCSYYRVCDTKYPPRKKSKVSSENILNSYKFRITPLLVGKCDIPFRRTTRRFWQTPDTLVEIVSEVVNRIPLPEAFKWTNFNVINWIKRLGFPQYMETFKVNLINGRTLILVDASVLVKMNITNFEHIEIISKAVRDLYETEKILRNRSISLPPRYPDTHYKLFRIRTGFKYTRTKRTDLWRQMKMIRKMPEYLTHWAALERWLKHLRPAETEMFGYALRRKLYKAKKAPEVIYIPELPELSEIDALMPPYYYGLKADDASSKRIKKLSVLQNLPPRPPREPITGALTVLKMSSPHKYLYQNSSLVNTFYIRPNIYKLGCPILVLFSMYTLFVVIIRRSLLRVRNSIKKEKKCKDK